MQDYLPVELQSKSWAEPAKMAPNDLSYGADKMLELFSNIKEGWKLTTFEWGKQIILSKDDKYIAASFVKFYDLQMWEVQTNFIKFNKRVHLYHLQNDACKMDVVRQFKEWLETTSRKLSVNDVSQKKEFVKVTEGKKKSSLPRRVKRERKIKLF